ncbi:MAG: response regulator transcription factor [Candidatus Parcubacteria bacterium]|jgi:DNA-binding response OmpR family regulator|nr:MAG: hypothetical protein JST_5230 [Candidatus Parcubacteria bacterium]
MHLTVFSFGGWPDFLEKLEATLKRGDPNKSEIFIPPESEVLIIIPGKKRAAAGSLCRHLRRAKIFLPIMVIGEKISLAQGENFLKSGADDYLSGDWELIELQARLEALRRRPQVFINSPLKIKNLKIDFFKRQASVNQKSLLLTPKEFDILEYLGKNQHRLVNREELSLELWTSNFNDLSQTVNSHLSNLRSKLKNSAAEVQITTVFGGGYFLK